MSIAAAVNSAFVSDPVLNTLLVLLILTTSNQVNVIFLSHFANEESGTETLSKLFKVTQPVK